MSNLHRLKFVVLLSLFTLAGGPAAPAADEAVAQDNSPLVTLNFPGGTLDDFVRALEAASDGPVNLVMPGYTEVPVPSIRVTNVSLQQVFAAIQRADRRIEFHSVNDPGSTVWAVQLAQRRAQPQIARTYSVEPLLDKYNINDLTTAIRTAWEMARAQETIDSSRDVNSRYWNDPGPAPELRFHQETKLLIVRGTQSDLQLAANVVEQLSPPRKPEPVPNRSPEELAALQKMKTDLEVERQTILVKMQEVENGPPLPVGMRDGRMPSLQRDLQEVEQKIKNIDAVAANPPN